jgi:hypothetical protein
MLANYLRKRGGVVPKRFAVGREPGAVRELSDGICGISGTKPAPSGHCCFTLKDYALVIADGGAIVREAAGAPAGTDVKLMFARALWALP